MALREPKFVDGGRMRVAGFEGFYTREQTAEIPAQWERFNAVLETADGRADEWTYGVTYPLPVMRYLTAIALEEGAPLPADWVEEEVPARRYAVFAEGGGVEGIRKTWMAIFAEWLPGSGMKVAGEPMLERYDDEWMRTGEFEIWIPV